MIKGTTIQHIYDLYQQFPHISIDSRSEVKNSIFFCLKGENFDGNKFAFDALQKGAAYVVTENRDLASHPQSIIVDNTTKALQQLALHHRLQLNIPIIGITGTNGKTTTKELIVSILQKKYKVAYTHGNLNNHIGVPLTLLSITKKDQIAVVEMGANHVGEIATLCEWVLPNYGIITNIGKAHLEGFGNIENITITKQALYKSVIKNKGTLFVNFQDELLRSLISNYSLVYYYRKKEDKISIKNNDLSTPYLSFLLNGRYYTTHLTGDYNLNNLLATIAIGHFFAVSDADIVSAIANYHPQNQRSQVIYQESNIIIADYYNANPSSMEVALQNLSSLTHSNKLAILGEMRELGENSRTEHKQIIDLCANLKILTFFIGDEFCFHKPEYCFKDISSLNQFLKENKIENRLLLIKGSRGIHLEEVKL